MNLGNTYLADRLTGEGMTIESALDHTYISTDLKMRAEVFKLETSSTDHVPIIAKILLKRKHKKFLNKKIKKRSMKNFNVNNWNNCLASKNWESLGSMENVNDMAIQFSKIVNESLDEIAPLKTFTIINPLHKR